MSDSGPLHLAAIVLVVVTVLGPAAPARAHLSQSALDEVSVAPAAGQQVPLSTVIVNDSGVAHTLAEAIGGRPALLVLADYTCKTLCGPILAMAAAELAQTGLRAGTDYRFLVVGLDPRDGAAEAATMKRAQIGDGPLAAASFFLTTDAAGVKRLTDALGYRYAYDSENDQFAHPTAAFVLTSDGRVARVLSGLGLTATDLRLALVEAGEGRIGTLADRVRLLCYGFDPVAGAYSAAIRRWLMIASAATVAALFGGIAFMLTVRRGPDSRPARVSPGTG
jgi:protein SCO1/2